MVEDSIILQICEAIAEKIVSEGEYEDMNWFYHEGEITPSHDFPALLVEPQDNEMISENNCESDYKREIKISLWLREQNARTTIRKAHYFVEKLGTILGDASLNYEIHPNIEKLVYSRSTGAKSAYLENANTGEHTFLADTVNIFFELEYNI